VYGLLPKPLDKPLLHCPISAGATCNEQFPFAKVTVCVTVSWFIQTGYIPAGMVSVAGEGPVGVKEMNTAANAEPLDGRASAASTPKRASCASNHGRRTMTCRT
jgi:hypothetical protein